MQASEGITIIWPLFNSLGSLDAGRGTILNMRSETTMDSGGNHAG